MPSPNLSEIVTTTLRNRSGKLADNVSRNNALLAKLRDGADAGTARMALEMATVGGAGCLGREGEIGTLAPGAVGDVAVWKLDGPLFAGGIADPIEAWLRCGPVGAWHTVVHGRFVVRDGHVVHPDLPRVLDLHARHAARIQQLG